MSRPFAVLSVLVPLVALAPPAAAQNTPSPNAPFFLPANIPATDADPLMDGQATDAPEWEDAMRLPDSFFFGTARTNASMYMGSFQPRRRGKSCARNHSAQRTVTPRKSHAL